MPVTASTASDETFTVLYFASAGTLTKKSSESMPAPLSLVGLFSKLEAQYPGMQDKILSCSAVTINLRYIDLEEKESIVIGNGDEVAIIPPVSSG